MNTLLLYYQRTTDIDDKMLWKEAAIDQECFVRGVLGRDLLHTPVFIIGMHRSKSIDLPVYGLALQNGIKVILSCNFHGWYASVELPKALPPYYLDPDLFDHGYGDDSRHFFCYGFEDKEEYGNYYPDNPECTKFRVELKNKYTVYMMLFLLNKAFPPKDIEVSNRSVDSIKDSIEEIFKKNGVFELIDISKDLGLENPTFRPILSGWEVLWRTYYTINKYLVETEKNYGFTDKCNNPEIFAEYIYKCPDALKVFALEEMAFKTIF